MTVPSMGVGETHHIAELGDVRLHYVRAGKGEPVLLVHGWPQTWYSWHRIIPHIVASGHEVIAVDMRGAGDSSRPLVGYDSYTVADDLRDLATGLGFGVIRVVSHDNGARVSYALAARIVAAVGAAPKTDQSLLLCWVFIAQAR